MYTVTLDCGTALAFRERDFLPAGGDVVPCRHHGYCKVVRPRAAGDTRRTVDATPRRRRPSQRELLEFLKGQPETTVHALRRQRFTLRLVAAAEREGLVDLDLPTGRVALRT